MSDSLYKVTLKQGFDTWCAYHVVAPTATRAIAKVDKMRKRDGNIPAGAKITDVERIAEISE